MPTERSNLSTERFAFFISHASEDGGRAKKLHDLLAEHVKVFLADASIRTGTDWPTTLVEAQNDSRYTVVLISEHTPEAEFQKREILFGIQLSLNDPDSHAVAPVYLDKRLKDVSTKGGRLMAFNLGNLQSMFIEDDGIETVAAKLLRLEGIEVHTRWRRIRAVWRLLRRRWIALLVSLLLVSLAGGCLVRLLDLRQAVANREQMVRFPAGDFKLPPPPGAKTGPGRTVRAPFWIDRLEVSVAQFETFADVPPQRDITGPRYPVVNVPFEDAQAYCVQRGARLPRAEEWERANMGADHKAHILQPDMRRKAHLKDPGFQVQPLKKVDDTSVDVTPGGIRNLGGNVAEWVIGVQRSPDQARQGDSESVVETRGGSILKLRADMGQILSAEAQPLAPRGWMNVGFRCAMDAAP